MAQPAPDEKRTIRIIQLIPNLLTLAAICAGLTAIRFGFQGDFEKAVLLVLVACFLDGLDGRLARLLDCSTLVGAELDSLADFLNFGVAPMLIVYAWGFEEFHRAGWIAMLAYPICCVLRLARFNVDSRKEKSGEGDMFVGVPSPAGAALVMLPMYVSFLFPDLAQTPAPWVAFYVVAVGILMISRVPTYAFKNVAVDRDSVKYLLLGAVLLAAALLSYPWATLVALSLAYMVSIALAVRSAVVARRADGQDRGG